MGPAFSFFAIRIQSGRHAPHGHRHPLSIMTELATDVFIDMGYSLVDGVEDAPEIENDYYCFEALNCPKDHPARDMQVLQQQSFSRVVPAF